MEITIQTKQKTQLTNITGQVASAVEELGVADGAVFLYVGHTTAAVTINEAADPDVALDIRMALDRLVPEYAGYRHLEGNSPAHVKATLVGPSEIVPVTGGRLALGTWQGIFFCEFDGPRTRKLSIRVLSSQ